MRRIILSLLPVGENREIHMTCAFMATRCPQTPAFGTLRPGLLRQLLDALFLLVAKQVGSFRETWSDTQKGCKSTVLNNILACDMFVADTKIRIEQTLQRSSFATHAPETAIQLPTKRKPICVI